MLTEISNQVRKWFAERDITHAVVGFSGGIDSTVTALLLNHAGIDVRLVVANAPNQRYSSPLGGKFLRKPSREEKGFCVEEFETYIIDYQWPFTLLDDNAKVANEAAGPIIRNAIFYGVAAKLRDKGHKAIVVGTVNFSEAAFLGFFGKSSDAAMDFYPISHLTKREVYDLARELNAPQEIIDATPSGDLFFEDTNDLKMIGATYDQIQAIIDCAESIEFSRVIRRQLSGLMDSVDNPEVFKDNIIRNAFKYYLPFPNFHLKDRLERFRNFPYNLVLRAASGI